MWSREGTYDEGPDAPVDEIRAAHFGECQPTGVGGRRWYQFRPGIIDDDEYLDFEIRELGKNDIDGKATVTMSAQYMLPDSTRKARAFRTCDLAPASEKYFFTNCLCSLLVVYKLAVRPTEMAKAYDLHVPCLVRYERSRNDVRGEGQNDKDSQICIVNLLEREPCRLDDAWLVEGDQAGGVRGIRRWDTRLMNHQDIPRVQVTNRSPMQ